MALDEGRGNGCDRCGNNRRSDGECQRSDNRDGHGDDGHSNKGHGDDGCGSDRRGDDRRTVMTRAAKTGTGIVMMDMATMGATTRADIGKSIRTRQAIYSDGTGTAAMCALTTGAATMTVTGATMTGVRQDDRDGRGDDGRGNNGHSNDRHSGDMCSDHRRSDDCDGRGNDGRGDKGRGNDCDRHGQASSKHSHARTHAT